MNDSAVYAHLVARALGTCSGLKSAAWTAGGPTELRDLARAGPLRDVPLVRLDPIVDGFRRAGTCPVSSAARMVSGQWVGIDWSDPTTERVLRASIPGDLTDLLRGTSRQVSLGARWRKLPSSCAAVDVADAHVHSGGISPPVVLIRALLGHLAEVPEEGFPDTLEVEDLADARFTVEPVLLALGISAMLLALDRRPALELQTLLPLLGADAIRIWPLAFDAMKDQERLLSLRRAYNDLLRRTSAPPDLQLAIGGIKDWLENRLDPVRGDLARGCLSGITLIHAALVSPTSATLDLFVERFSLMRRLRKLDGGADVDRIEESLRFMLSAGKLKRVELRKTASAAVAAADGQTRVVPAAAIEADIAAHATAVRRVRVQHRELVAQMPVSFHRYRVEHEEMILGPARLRVPLQGVMEVAQGIVNLCVGNPDIRDFVGSVDVAGSELRAPNWIFGLGFTYIHRAMAAEGVEPLRYTVHAGEQFFEPLDGLRRIGETLLFEAPVTRIGHGLALSPEIATRRGSGLASAVKVMESLVWAAYFQHHLRSEVDLLCRELASVVFRPWTPTLDELTEWLVARFDFDRMRQIGFMPDPARFRQEQLPVGERIDLATLRRPSRVDKMIVASVVEEAVGVSYDEEAPVPTENQAEAERLTALCYEACVDVVRTEFEERRTIESCPSSNLAMADLTALDGHPIGEFKRAGLQVTVNSDDPGLFGALVEEEIVGLYESGVLGSGRQSARHLDEILDHSYIETAAGLTSARCGELVDALSR
jgi:hypothetical protein